MTIASSVEYRPVKSYISLNLDPSVVFTEQKAIGNFPLYLKLILGDKFRVCPNFGAFIRTNSNYGWTTGLSIEYQIKDDFFIIAKGDIMKDYYKNEYPNKFGWKDTVTDKESNIWLSIGVKKNIIRLKQ